MSPIPVIVCGKTLKIANVVKAGLGPEYSLQHLISSLEDGIAHLPILLSGQTPPPQEKPEMQIGTQDYSSPPQAIILGGGYDSEAIAKMRKACENVKNPVPWLQKDQSRETPPYGEDYGKHIVNRAKEKMDELRKEGKLGKILLSISAHPFIPSLHNRRLGSSPFCCFFLVLFVDQSLFLLSSESGSSDPIFIGFG